MKLTTVVTDKAGKRIVWVNNPRRDYDQAAAGTIRSEGFLRRMKPLKQRHALSINEFGINEGCTGESSSLADMKLDLKVIRFYKIPPLKTEGLRVFDDNVIERLDAIQLIANVANLRVRLKEPTGLQPEESGLIIVSLHAWYNGFSHRVPPDSVVLETPSGCEKTTDWKFPQSDILQV
jgi:hypothetical protein